MTGAVIIGHGDFGACLCGMLEAITGITENVSALSNKGLSTPELLEALDKAVGSLASNDIILFVDTFGGSCWQAAKMFRVEHQECHIVTGINLPMLLSFVHKRDTNGVIELCDILDNDGRRGITHE